MLVFFDSDTQNDYILATGKFALPNAENLRENLKRLTDFARKRKLRIISSVDRHFGTKKYRSLEVSELDVWGGPFPLHCVDGTPGQKKIKETASKKAALVENRKYSSAAIKRICAKREIVIEKQKFSAFSNPNTAKILKFLKVKKAVLYGVATDYQVRSAALELRQMGIDVYLVIDAVKSLNVRPTDGEISTRQMQAAGVRIVTASKVLTELPIFA
ncbi:MAG: isochorismatase family protein [Candidatus Micrarchaeota archaeon]